MQSSPEKKTEPKLKEILKLRSNTIPKKLKKGYFTNWCYCPQAIGSVEQT
jgi:hypothetical protein